MLSGIKSRLQHLRISTKLTLVQVAILAVILFIISPSIIRPGQSWNRR